MPVTRPRRATNHRLVTVATNASAIEPVPRPTSTPQHRISCHGWVMNTVRPLPAATRTSAAPTTRRSPNRSISAAANGAVSPYRMRLTEIAVEIVPRDQPNAACNGSINTPGVARKPAAPTVAIRVAAATIQARWILGVRETLRVRASVSVTWSSFGASSPDTSGLGCHYVKESSHASDRRTRAGRRRHVRSRRADADLPGRVGRPAQPLLRGADRHARRRSRSARRPASRSRRITARRSLDTADTVIVAGIDGMSHRAASAPLGTRRVRPDPPRYAHHVDLHRRIRAGRAGPARWPPGDHALGLRGRVPAPVPEGPPRPGRALRRRRRRADQRRRRSRDRPVPARRPQGSRQRGGESGGPARRRAAVARRRAVAVHRAADAGSGRRTARRPRGSGFSAGWSRTSISRRWRRTRG